MRTRSTHKIIIIYNKTKFRLCQYNENVKLYAELRDQCDGDITCNIIDQDSVILLSSGNNCTLSEVIKLVEGM